ncbi:GspH/FimT family pseudopilin [Variovorax terrae]|uniref:Type II secretion system protein H n=1 Tax=Variovorax terrae TaxID=2923278 RepID=A0A9X1VTG6_9BURK|nr:GspH/FimT family pseudopilin [Variovorax terrae]MCJ0762804.1 GspH/FimT family pseudopilin [Variovorax terrae]
MLAMTRAPAPPQASRARALGFTLIELLMVIAIAAILMGLAAPSFRNMLLNQKLASSASNLLGDVMQARNEALAKNRRVTVQPASGTNWAAGWVVYVDLNNNGSYDSGSDTLISQSGAVHSALTITGKNGGAVPANLSFDSRGFLQGNAGTRLVFSSADTARQKHVIVYLTGRARLCDPSTANCTADT